MKLFQHRMVSLSLFVCVVLALTISGIGLLAPAKAHAQCCVFLNPQTHLVQAGHEIHFYGYGFNPDEWVSTWATTPREAVVTGKNVRVKDEGELSFSFKVPEEAESGQWSMTVRSEESNMLVITYFQVLGRDPSIADYQAAASPPVAPPGTEFAFAATGFDDEEDVSYWITAPDAHVYEAFPKGAESNDDGRVDITWFAPHYAPQGTWVITMQGYDSDVARAIPFDVRIPQSAPVAAPAPTSAPAPSDAPFCPPQDTPAVAPAPPAPTAQTVPVSTIVPMETRSGGMSGR